MRSHREVTIQTRRSPPPSHTRTRSSALSHARPQTLPGTRDLPLLHPERGVYYFFRCRIPRFVINPDRPVTRSGGYRTNLVIHSSRSFLSPPFFPRQAPSSSPSWMLPGVAAALPRPGCSRGSGWRRLSSFFSGSAGRPGRLFSLPPESSQPQESSTLLCRYPPLLVKDLGSR